MKKMFVGNLPSDTNEDEVKDLFSQHGKVRSIKVAADVFSGRCKGFAFIEMEGHEARAAMAGLDGKMFKGQALKVREERPRMRGGRGRAGR
ncbi:MAG TPA: RNA-binding protein [Gammaproteobacteria bacterium]|nr:RNA-binding protein [Gammaproteobacteria bacterium]